MTGWEGALRTAAPRGLNSMGLVGNFFFFLFPPSRVTRCKQSRGGRAELSLCSRAQSGVPVAEPGAVLAGSAGLLRARAPHGR